ncbi:MAG: hypothetical protein JOZ71_09170 [Ktedonobacteraceae bacterium]|nr:hypothetical protein [Ktedonobacteraceae bacterium]
MIKKKRPAHLEPWSPYRQSQEPPIQQTQPLPVLGTSSAGQETSEQCYHRLKALSDLTGERLLFVYLHDQGRSTIEESRRRKGQTRW